MYNYLYQAIAFAYILKEQKDGIKIKFMLFEPQQDKHRVPLYTTLPSSYCNSQVN